MEDVVLLVFRRNTFIRDRKLSTGILGKNKICSVLKFLDVRDEPDNLTVYSAKNIVNSMTMTFK